MYIWIYKCALFVFPIIYLSIKVKVVVLFAEAVIDMGVPESSHLGVLDIDTDLPCFKLSEFKLVY